MTLRDISNHPVLSLLHSDIELTQLVDIYDGVMSKDSSLIHIGNFVTFQDYTTASIRVCMCKQISRSNYGFFPSGE